MNRKVSSIISASILATLLGSCAGSNQQNGSSGDGNSPEGRGVFTDYRGQKPGMVHKITPADLPPPYATKSADRSPSLIRRPHNAWPQAPA